MPKVDIDYSNTIIYKIVCKDPLVTHLYVGHTTNFVQRKHAHKQTCNNIKSQGYNLKLYKTIRENGNWSNWDMSIINFYNCKNNLEARQKEQTHFSLLNANLNSIEPCSMHDTLEHIIDQKPIINKKFADTIINKKQIDNAEIVDTIIDKKQNDDINKISDFQCDKCDFKCLKKGDWNRHLLTQKHQYEPNEPEITPSITEKSQLHTCLCGEIFNSRTTAWRHKKKCKSNSKNEITMTINEIDSKPTMLTEEMVKKLITQNNDMRQMMMDQNAKILELVLKSQLQSQSNVLKVSNKNNNIINNNFNLNVYLNEECKGAINLEDFVRSLEVKLSDLEETAKKGYTEGVSRIFINGLNELDENKRPIHCSDLKREVLYIKNNDEWTKEDPSKKEITNAIKRVSKKNMRQINEWQKKYPGYKDPESKDNDKYLEMLCGAMGGSTDEEQMKNLEKIKRNITKEVVIEKCRACVA